MSKYLVQMPEYFKLVCIIGFSKLIVFDLSTNWTCFIDYLWQGKWNFNRTVWKKL